MPTKHEKANRYTFSVELLVPDSVNFAAAALMENVHDAIYAYDEAGRLFNRHSVNDGLTPPSRTWLCLQQQA